MRTGNGSPPHCGTTSRVIAVEPHKGPGANLARVTGESATSTLPLTSVSNGVTTNLQLKRKAHRRTPACLQLHDPANERLSPLCSGKFSQNIRIRKSMPQMTPISPSHGRIATAQRRLRPQGTRRQLRGKTRINDRRVSRRHGAAADVPDHFNKGIPPSPVRAMPVPSTISITLSEWTLSTLGVRNPEGVVERSLLRGETTSTSTP